MDERIMKFRVGVVVLAAGMITVILVMLFAAWPQFLQPQFEIKVGFPKAPGVAVNTPVRKSGVLIGRVSNIQLRDEGGVVLTLRIDADRRLRMNETPRITTGSLVTGDATVEFVRAEDDPDDRLIEDGDYIPTGTVASDPFDVLVSMEGTMTDAFRSLERAGTEVTEVLERLQSTFGEEERLARILDKTELALDDFSGAFRQMEDLFGDEELRGQLKESVRDLPAVFREARETLKVAKNTLDGFGQLTGRVETNLDNLEKFTGSLGDQGPVLVENVGKSVEKLDELLEQLVVFSHAINDEEGSIGRLVNDDELYSKLDRTVSNVEYLTRRLRPVMDDLRVFSDKIARDPRQLGVRGALDRRPGGLKTGVR